MQLTSPSFSADGTLPDKYAYKHDNISPALSISGVPDGAQSLALIVTDPDAPMGEWVHWLMWNIPPYTTAIAEDEVPTSATEGLTDYGQANWGGPAPPSGTHRYVFTLYALDTTLDLPNTSKRDHFETSIQDHIIESCELIGTYTHTD